MFVRVGEVRDIDARSARRLRQETWDFLLEESMFSPVTCKAGDIDAADGSSIELNQLNEKIHTSLKGLAWATELLHNALPMEHL